MAELVELSGQEVVLADGFDEAIIGIDLNSPKPRVIYDQYKIINTLRRDSSMTEEEAQEFFDYNIAGAYMGEQTPIYVHPI